MPVLILSARHTTKRKKSEEILMLENLIYKITQEGVINPKEREVIEFGLKQGVNSLLGIIVMIIIGFFMGIWGESIIFIFVFVPLRIFAGGYHSKTQFRCAMVSILLVIAAFCGIIYIVNSFFVFSLMLFSFLVIYQHAPVQNGKRPLDEVEFKTYKKRSRLIMCIQSLIFIVLFIVGYQKGINILMCAWLLESVLIFMEKMNLYHLCRHRYMANAE